MAGSTLIVLELVLVFGGVAAFCAWELYALRKDRRKSAQKEDSSASGNSSGTEYC